MPDAPPVLNPGFGTDYLLFRKDRIRCVAGAQYLTEHRLKPHSPTRRVVARCCNSAMFLDFTKGHWLSLYRDRFGADAPPIAMRIMTKYREEGVVLDDALPNYPVPNRKILLPLLAAWVAMGFRRPQIGWGKGELTP